MSLIFIIILIILLLNIKNKTILDEKDLIYLKDKTILFFKYICYNLSTFKMLSKRKHFEWLIHTPVKIFSCISPHLQVFLNPDLKVSLL